MKNKILLSSLILLQTLVVSVWPDSGIGKVFTKVQFLPEAHFDGEIRRFAHQKNDDFIRTYLYETDLAVDQALMRYDTTFYFLFRGELNANLGESPFGLAMHPYQMNYAINPMVEYRLPKMVVTSGIDHRCFHYIDEEPREPIVYWNRAFIGVSSVDRRTYPRTSVFLLNPSLSPFSRLTWHAEWGYYISEFFDIVRPINLMSLTRPHYLHQFDVAARYAIAAWSSGILELTSASMLGFKRSGEAYWAQQFGTEVFFARKTYDGGLFLRFTLDGGRFNSKDQLIEFGIRAEK